MMLLIGAGVATGMLCAGVVLFSLTAEGPEPKRPAPSPVARPLPPVVAPPPAPLPPVAAPPPPKPPPVAAKPVPPKPSKPQSNEAWVTQRMGMRKHLKGYDFCGREAILRKQDIPRRYRLRARFGADGQGTWGRVEPAPVAMLNPCINNATQYIFLGKLPEAREVEVEVTLSFAHLRPTGEPETHDSQWNIKDYN